MAAGVPVVATRSGAVSKTVRDRQTGFLVGKNQPKALAQSILRLLHDDDMREKMGRAARLWVHQRFTWDRVAEKIYQRYTDLCG